MRRLLVLAPLALTGCALNGGAPEGPSADPVDTPRLTGARAHAAAPAAAAALARVPDGPDARRRLGYVDAERLATAELPVPARAVIERVLGRGADALAGEAVRVGRDMTFPREPAGAAPQTSAITPAAPSAVQSCLGDTFAQTILGPGLLGDDAALGAGLAESADPPAGIQLRVCGAPKYVRDLHAMRRRLERRFGSLPGALISEREIGEREIVAAVLPGARLRAGELLGPLAGGRSLRALGWRR
jgi:hypothetical protein